MILELLEYLFTPCPIPSRSMGFLTSTVQVRARYRRCWKAWSPHIERTRAAILDAASRCRNRRKAALLGAGLLHDIPLRELSERFGRVLLVDVVHPWPSRWAARRFRNVERVSADVTEVMDRLGRIARTPGEPLPVSRPMRFIDDPELDFTVSVNLLSQIPYIPGRYLAGRRDEATVDAFLTHLVQAHLDYLCRLPGHTALITDTTVKRTTPEGEILEEWDPLYGVGLPTAEEAWEWRLAPSPEVARSVDVGTSVAAYPDWKKVACPGSRAATGPQFVKPMTK